MIHQRQCLPLGIEAREDRPRVHAGTDQLEGDQSPEWRLLFGEIHHAHAAFAKLADDSISGNVRRSQAEARGRQRLGGGFKSGALEKLAGDGFELKQ